MPQNLTIVDMEGNVLADGVGVNSAASLTYTQSQLDAQRAYEHGLELRIQSMLENVLGPDKAVVRVAAEMNWDQVKREGNLPAGSGRQCCAQCAADGGNVRG